MERNNRQGFGADGHGGDFAWGFHLGFSGGNQHQSGRGRGRGRGRFGGNNRHDLPQGNNGRWFGNGGGQGWNGGFGHNAGPNGSFNSGSGFPQGSFGRPADASGSLYFGVPPPGSFPLGGQFPVVGSQVGVPPGGALMPPGVAAATTVPGGLAAGGPATAVAPVVPAAGAMAPGGALGVSATVGGTLVTVDKSRATVSSVAPVVSVADVVDVVIGDHLYELSFRVESDHRSGYPIPLDMENCGDGDVEKKEEGKKDKDMGKKSVLGDSTNSSNMAYDGYPSERGGPLCLLLS
ncbi:glycine-rich cell wall structural protein 1-like [Oryza glaberrima]|uniref:glycine-rich cell wall structural protein 1-like n=1 Tax=Oryza glaberrima TaxID=4538 RepID=UPI00224C1756|nr:glycine-rich cell wall structural protein 1-like [Oryza glaberrima]